MQTFVIMITVIQRVNCTVNRLKCRLDTGCQETLALKHTLWRNPVNIIVAKGLRRPPQGQCMPCGDTFGSFF
jgi:hypothetical protein